MDFRPKSWEVHLFGPCIVIWGVGLSRCVEEYAYGTLMGFDGMKALAASGGQSLEASGESKLEPCCVSKLASQGVSPDGFHS